MKRYIINAPYGNVFGMYESDAGNYVRYEDAAKRIAELTAERDEARALVREAACDYDVWDVETGKKCIAVVKRWEK